MMKLQILLWEFQFPLETFIKCLTKMLTHPRGSRGGGGGLGQTLIWCKWAVVWAFGVGMVVFKVLSLIPPFSIVDKS